MAPTRGSPRLYASKARTKASPSILSVFARRRRRDVAIEAGSTTWLSIPSLCRTRWIQDPVDPEPVQPRFLDDDDGKDLPRPDAGFLLELGQARKESADVTAAHRVLRHLLAAARSEGGDDPG